MDYTPYTNEIRYLLFLSGVDVEKPMDLDSAVKFNNILNDIERTVTVFSISRSIAQRIASPIVCDKCGQEMTRLEYLKSYYVSHIKLDKKKMEKRRETAHKQEVLKRKTNKTHSHV